MRLKSQQRRRTKESERRKYTGIFLSSVRDEDQTGDIRTVRQHLEPRRHRVAHFRNLILLRKIIIIIIISHIQFPPLLSPPSPPSSSQQIEDIILKTFSPFIRGLRRSSFYDAWQRYGPEGFKRNT